ncbi:MAG: DsbA family oxidoreductase [Paracoccaceae bacterium]
MIRLDILSDPICPWCYLGKVRLDRALEARPDHPFAVEWHPFQLNPDMPPEGMDRRAYLEAKFGGKEGAVQAYLPLVEHAAASGVALNLDRIARTPNTLDAHRLIHWAGLEGRQGAMVAALFRAYFREGRDIGDAGVLAALAGEAGLDPAVVARLLACDADRALVAERDAHARARGVSAVPTFILADTYVISGAQTPETWVRIIDELIEKEKATSA